MEEIFVNTIYCDDVRQEVSGKQSFMGVYNSDMLLPSFPVTLPKLCVQVSIRFPIDTAAKKAVVRITNGDETMAEIPIPEGELQKMSKAILENDESPSEVIFLGVAVHLQFTPLQLNQRTKIRTYAVVDDVEIKGNSLVVRLPTDGERASLGIPG